MRGAPALEERRGGRALPRRVHVERRVVVPARPFGFSLKFFQSQVVSFNWFTEQVLVREQVWVSGLGWYSHTSFDTDVCDGAGEGSFKPA